jgi:signal transduction histidine kinase
MPWDFVSEGTLISGQNPDFTGFNPLPQFLCYTQSIPSTFSNFMSFQSRFKLSQSPFPLLFQLELILMTVVMSSVVWLMIGKPPKLLAPATSLIPTIVALTIFIAIGFVIPTKSQTKRLYLALEFLLIGIIFNGSMVPFFQMLFITVVIRNCIFLTGQARSIATGLACFGYLVCRVGQMRHPVFSIASPEQNWIFGLVSLLTFGLVILFIQLFVDAILKEQDSKRELAIVHAQLQQYALQVEDFATVQERNRIARDIHDSLGHSLSIFNLHLAAALRLFHKKPTEAEALLRELQAVGQQAMTDVSHSVATLRADPLNGQPLHLSILSLVEQFTLSTGVMPRFQWVQGEDESFPLSNIQKMTIYRIVQESLTNIRKYANASIVEIKVEIKIQHQIHNLIESIQIHVIDNGKGFDRTASTTGFGLQGMQERLAALSGYLEITSAPDQGCQILASFPIVHPLSSFSP